MPLSKRSSPSLPDILDILSPKQLHSLTRKNTKSNKKHALRVRYRLYEVELERLSADEPEPKPREPKFDCERKTVSWADEPRKWSEEREAAKTEDDDGDISFPVPKGLSEAGTWHACHSETEGAADVEAETDAPGSPPVGTNQDNSGDREFQDENSDAHNTSKWDVPRERDELQDKKSRSPISYVRRMRKKLKMNRSHSAYKLLSD
ncbi:hypothetical protein EJ06DRAFT_557975 [Trichodelitschia bisporula]|uniref:Uncharacterized protein n=1 Tax=Trichodelitschia bisporula TaxID=703511 RepID=A0A6G1HRW0_9PEZI|nr:hypothetical protein EJ06DRAFT_557975 [Trichodelitschia bisporula]